jgi:hypothetical protein
MQLTAVCFAVVLCAGALLPLSRAAQRPARLPTKKPGARYLMFIVTVKGSGETKVDLTTRTWSVDRTFKSGLLELSGEGPLLYPGMSDAEKFEALLGKKGRATTSTNTPLFVTINDSLKTETTEACPSPKGPYNETTTIVKTWVGKGEVRTELPTGVAAVLDIKNDNVHYNVFIPLVSSKRSAKPLVYTEETTVTGKPTKKVIENRSLSSVGVPKVEGILDYPAIRHGEEQPLDYFESDFNYDSREVTPSEPVFPEIRESRFQVKVRVRYQWSTGPFSSLPEIE